MPTPTLPRPSFRLNTTTNAGQDSAVVAGLSDGRFVAVWRDQDGGSTATLKYAIFNADGTVAKSETVANQSTVGEIFAGDVAVAALTGGGFAITWSSRFNFQNDVFHRVFNSSGAAVTGDLTSNIGATLGDQRHPDIVGDGAGGFYVVWEDLAATPNVQLRHFNSTGQAVGSAAGLSDLVGGDEVPAIAINRAGTQFAVVWDDDLGQTQGGNEDSIRGFVSGGAEFRVDSGPYEHFHGAPDVAYSTGSSYMAVWSKFVAATGDYHVAGRINGGGEFQVNTSPHTNDTTMPVVVGLQSGNFLVVWSDGGFNGGLDVLGQLFSVGGAKIGSEFVVTDFSPTSLARIEASELLDGRVLVTWDANKLNQTVGVDAIARIVDPRQGPSNWLGTNAPEQYVGTGFADVLNGAGGNDRLWGEGAADQMTGGTGDDLFYVNHAGDKTFEANAQGNDRVLTSISYALVAGQHIEVLATTAPAGAAAINLTGNDLAQRVEGNNGVNAINGKGGNDVLLGNGGNDTLTGGPGGDTLNGGLGNDVYVLENGVDAIADSGGVDTITSTVTRSIAGYATVENLTLVNVAAALNGTGNNLNNVITGNNLNNTLTGGVGNDTLRGLNGSDTLAGGLGMDTLTGGAQNDFFVLNAPLNVANRDTITDFFNVAGNNDTIRLENGVMTQLGAPGVLAANKFFAGAAAHDADDRIVYNKANGAVYYDSNGNAAGGSTLLAIITTKPTLGSADFVVI